MLNSFFDVGGTVAAGYGSFLFEIELALPKEEKECKKKFFKGLTKWGVGAIIWMCERKGGAQSMACTLFWGVLTI